MNHTVPMDDDTPEPALQAIDLLLGEGSAAEQAGLRVQIDGDPMTMLAMAETVALIEQLREVRVEAGSAYADKLAQIVRRATHRLPSPQPTGWGGPLFMAAAALVACVGLHYFDPAGLHEAAAVEWIHVERRPQTQVAVPNVVPELAEVAWESAVDRMRQRLGEADASLMREAFEDGLRPDRDALSRWIDPRNALVWLRLDHELRANAARRVDVIAEHGGLLAVDERAQQLAFGLAAQLPSLMLESPSPRTVAVVALAVRALIATGADPRRSQALALAGDWLSVQCPRCTGAARVTALAGLIEYAAIYEAHRDAVRGIGETLVDEVLRSDVETWEKRRLPELVGNHIEAAVLGDVGRVLAKLPAFGVEGARCALVRQLCLGQLRTRCASGAPSAEVCAALVFGYADLLPELERAEVELQLLRWKPVRLLPDFVTVQQLAWGIEPGRRGFSRLQNELRQLAVCPTPVAFAERAVFCLCLAKDYAAFGGHAALAAVGGS